MLPAVYLFHREIPMFGICIALGAIIANLAAIHQIKKSNLDINDFLIAECFAMLGAFVGAKLLYILVSYRSIDFSRLLEIDYFNDLMRSGFVFYGGLIGAGAALAIPKYLCRINLGPFLQKTVFAIPLAHGFGRIGCFFAGCCYGCPYHGIGAVHFSHSLIAPTDIPLFPVQIVEAVLLILLSFIIYKRYSCKERGQTGIEFYLVSYAVIRFFLEFLRFDYIERGSLHGLSTSQWISIMICIAVATAVFYRKKTHAAQQYAGAFQTSNQ